MTNRTSQRRLLLPMLVVTSCLMPIHSPAQAQDTSTFAGCITDKVGQPLPGVTVDVGANGAHRIVVSNSRGCYAVQDLPAGSYNVFARLPGFVSVTREGLHVQPGRSQAVDFQMRVAPICECVSWFQWTLASLWEHADAVVRLRITGHDSTDPEVTHQASVLSVWKGSPAVIAGKTLTFRRRIEPAESEPYAVGQEFVIFLEWSPQQQAFIRMSNDGLVAAFGIENRRIHGSPLAHYVGTDSEQLVKELAALATR